jgi:hypothetical protein
MRGTILIISVLLVAPGCATTQLAFTTSRQMGSEPDLYGDQVLENLGRLTNDPITLPYFALLNNGVPSISDMGSLTVGSLTWPAQGVVKALHNQRTGTIGPIGGSRTVGANWTISPINDPDRLTAMRILYRWVLGIPPESTADANTLLQQYIGKDFTLDATKVPPGWFQHGRRNDVPKEACRQFHHHGTYYWIVPGMEEQLAQLTLKMLDIATVIPSKPQETVQWTIDPRTNTTTQIQVTRNQDQSSPIPHDPTNRHSLNIRAVAPSTEQPLKERFNNYSNPIVSPGLFSQPR